MNSVSVTPVAKCGCAHATEYGKQELERVKRAYGLSTKPWQAAGPPKTRKSARVRR